VGAKGPRRDHWVRPQGRGHQPAAEPHPGARYLQAVGGGKHAELARAGPGGPISRRLDDRGQVRMGPQPAREFRASEPDRAHHAQPLRPKLRSVPRRSFLDVEGLGLAKAADWVSSMRRFWAGPASSTCTGPVQAKHASSVQMPRASLRVALVDLCRQRRLHMPVSPTTDHRQTRFSQCAVTATAIMGPAFKGLCAQWQVLLLLEPQRISAGLVCDLDLSNHFLACFSDDTHA